MVVVVEAVAGGVVGVAVVAVGVITTGRQGQVISHRRAMCAGCVRSRGITFKIARCTTLLSRVETSNSSSSHRRHCRSLRHHRWIPSLP